MMSKVANKSDKGRAAGPDSTQIMLQKNDRIKDKHMKELRRLGCEAQRSSTDLEKQVRGRGTPGILAKHAEHCKRKFLTNVNL